MVVHYLQRSRVLPYLQSPLAGLPDLVPVLVDEWNVAFHSDVDLLFANGHAGSDNLVTAAQLLVGFFHYFAFEFDFQNHIVQNIYVFFVNFFFFFMSGLHSRGQAGLPQKQRF